MMHFFWLPWQRNELKFDQYQYANAEIVKGAWRHFGDAMSVYHMNASTEVSPHGQDDFIIGHPAWPAPDGPSSWLDANLNLRAYSMAPWVDLYIGHQFFNTLMRTRLFFAMCGSIWFDRTMRRSPDDIMAALKPKIVRVNMGCDAEMLPFRHDLGGRNRTFLHLSALREHKNPEMLYRLFEGLPATLWIGSGTKPETTLSNVRHIGHIDNADPEVNANILNNCGFYIHTANYDAQATSILECCARGLVPILTPESGFYSDHALYLNNDEAHNRALLLRAIAMSDSEYEARSVGVRRQILAHHSWPSIYQRVEDCIRADVIGEPIDQRGGVYS